MESSKTDIHIPHPVNHKKKGFIAQILFDCDRDTEYLERIHAALNAFAKKFPSNIADHPRVTLASDGVLIDIKVICHSKNELLNLNIELERTAYRYGLRSSGN